MEPKEKDLRPLITLVTTLLSDTSVQGLVMSEVSSLIGNIIAKDEIRDYLTKALAIANNYVNDNLEEIDRLKKRVDALEESLKIKNHAHQVWENMGETK